MRLPAVCLTLALIASPAMADTASVADQAQRAYDLYAGGLSQQAFLSAGYGERLFGNIDGRWVRLNGPDNKTGIESYGAFTNKYCKGPAALTLASTSKLTLTMTTALPAGTYTQSFTLVAGSTFGEHTDPAPYLAALGLGPDKTGDAADQQRALVLSLTNGMVQIYRPSEDALVMTRDRGYPIVMVRCPAASGG